MVLAHDDLDAGGGQLNEKTRKENGSLLVPYHTLCEWGPKNFLVYSLAAAIQLSYSAPITEGLMLA
jgi:hypothetical protein